MQRAIEQQLSDENALIDAQQAYQGQLDQYKILIGMDVRQELEIVPVDLDVAEPNVDGQDPIALAIKYRLDLANARDAIDDAPASRGHQQRIIARFESHLANAKR